MTAGAPPAARGPERAAPVPGSNGASRTASSGGGACSTRLSLRSGTGCDALRLLFEVERPPEHAFEVEGWNGGRTWNGLCFLEQKGGDAGELWSPARVRELGHRARELVDASFGIRKDRGVSRADFTTTRRFPTAQHGRAFMAGMAALEFPRLEATRRGTPPHSVWWTGPRSRKIRNRVYDKSRERGGEPWLAIRLEDQRSFPTRYRWPVELVADPDFQREHFEGRFGPMRKAVEGVKAASFPVIAQALADEVKYGYRSAPEARALAGSLVLLGGGAHDGIKRATLYRWRRELREAGYVVAPDFMEPVEVDLAAELGAALEEFGT